MKWLWSKKPVSAAMSLTLWSVVLVRRARQYTVAVPMRRPEALETGRTVTQLRLVERSATNP